ncbi:hypothetical protein RSAG8_04373, partial [Rhizoctonia solani AG-8 WAC10335]
PICFLAFVGAAFLREEWRYVWGWKEGAREDASGKEVEGAGEDKRFGLRCNARTMSKMSIDRLFGGASYIGVMTPCEASSWIQDTQSLISSLSKDIGNDGESSEGNLDYDEC